MYNPFDLQGIRQFIKFCHVYSCLEKLSFPKILDVGCGYGEFYNFLEQNGFKCDYAGLDIRKKVGENVKNFVKFDLVSGKVLPFCDSTFNVILLLDILQNINKETGQKLIPEIARIVKIGGVVCISTRNFLLTPDTDAAHHIYRWNIEELFNELKHSNLKICNVFGINYGYDELEAFNNCQSSSLKKFLPRRFFRVLCGLNNWTKCKYVMLDCIKK